MAELKRGQIVCKPSWRELDENDLQKYLQMTAVQLLKTGFPDGIMLFQKLVDKFPDPLWRCVHAEMIIDGDPRNGDICPEDEVWTTSQEEIIKIRKRKRAHFVEGMRGDRPQYMVFEPNWDIDERYWAAIEEKIINSMKRSNWWGIYDVGEIAMHVINPVVNFFRKIAGKKYHHYSWLEMPNKYVCSSWIATLCQNGLEAKNWARRYLWPLDWQWFPKKNADVKPAHFAVNPRLTRIMP